MELEGIVCGVAQWYADRCWWADLSDLRQEAWVGALEAVAQPQYDESRSERHRVNYVRQAVFFRLKEYVWANSAPVSGPKGRRNKLKGCYRAPVEALFNHAAPDVAELEAQEQWWADLRALVHQAVHDGRHGEIAARVLLAKDKPGEVAADAGLTINQVWRASSNARKRIAQDLDIRESMVQGAQSA